MLKPINISGSWDDGYALDNHMLSSEFLGYDEHGNEKFNNTRTPIGELVYQIKYNNRKDKLKDLLEIMKGFLDYWQIKDRADLVISVPPSKQTRANQPVFEIANMIGGYLQKPVENTILTKSTNLQAKDGNTDISGAIIKNKTFDKPVSVLMIDDLYRTGATLNEAVKVLKTDSNVENVYVLVMTKTRR